VPRVAGGGDPAEGWGAEKVVRQVEVWMIEMKPNGARKQFCGRLRNMSTAKEEVQALLSKIA